MDVVIHATGPLFDGRAPEIIELFLDEARWDIGTQGYADVMHALDLAIKHPTPYYETQILTERMTPDVVVHDRAIIYGPWLEGVGSRNQTTRFKGYFAFRRTAQALQLKADGIAEHTLHAKGYLRMLGGER